MSILVPSETGATLTTLENEYHPRASVAVSVTSARRVFVGRSATPNGIELIPAPVEFLPDIPHTLSIDQIVLLRPTLCPRTGQNAVDLPAGHVEVRRKRRCVNQALILLGFGRQKGDGRGGRRPLAVVLREGHRPLEGFIVFRVSDGWCRHEKENAKGKVKRLQNEAAAANPRDQSLLRKSIPKEASSDGGIVEGLRGGVGRD